MRHGRLGNCNLAPYGVTVVKELKNKIDKHTMAFYKSIVLMAT